MSAAVTSRLRSLVFCDRMVWINSSRGGLIGLSAGYLRLMAVLTAGLLLLAFATFRVQSERANFGLFRYASLYMLSAMIILAMRAF